MLAEFKEFIARGNAIDLAVGVVIGAAFTAIVNTLVNGVIMPIIGLILGGLDFSNLFIVLKDGNPGPPYATLVAASDAGASVLTYGAFINAIVTFLIVAFVIFLMVKAINKVRKPAEEPPMKDCPYCGTSIPDAATRCPACTSQLTNATLAVS